jgi:proteasome accessory factor C
MIHQQKILRVLQLIVALQSNPPKSKSQLSEIIDSGTRTLYRYFTLLEEIGFKIHKDDQKKYFVEKNSILEVESFTEQEVNYLKSILLSNGNNNNMSKAILQKIAIRSEVQIATELMGNAHISKIIEYINDAIISKKQVILKKYQSINSQTIGDRLVEPISIDPNYRTITAFEVASLKNKTFVVERIKEVAHTTIKFKHEDEHLVIEKDIFGFGTRSDNKVFPIQLELSLKAKVLITEEYPETAQFIKAKTTQHKKTGNKKSYILECQVNDMRPIERFVKGLPTEIKPLENHNPFGVSYFY